ncbi:uncharacterized protein CLUP02_08238 [Colletotrichum lupini]|uniref:Uncharacterized protein n=1 Tax=Colletotrichum lupini TaxID=145971 RepID=A0A9Q8WGF7_9PEZI|nr:uncharacterized protein CLUP02_08238 [Colletotrichum lupini]UQC82748.1 hypothetical protein CLUP02_08238 [Colletotrichum lupini]
MKPGTDTYLGNRVNLAQVHHPWAAVRNLTVRAACLRILSPAMEVPSSLSGNYLMCLLRCILVIFARKPSSIICAWPTLTSRNYGLQFDSNYPYGVWRQSDKDACLPYCLALACAPGSFSGSLLSVLEPRVWPHAMPVLALAREQALPLIDPVVVVLILSNSRPSAAAMLYLLRSGWDRIELLLIFPGVGAPSLLPHLRNLPSSSFIFSEVPNFATEEGTQYCHYCHEPLLAGLAFLTSNTMPMPVELDLRHPTAPATHTTPSGWLRTGILWSTTQLPAKQPVHSTLPPSRLSDAAQPSSIHRPTNCLCFAIPRSNLPPICPVESRTILPTHFLPAPACRNQETVHARLPHLDRHDHGWNLLLKPPRCPRWGSIDRPVYGYATFFSSSLMTDDTHVYDSSLCLHDLHAACVSGKHQKNHQLIPTRHSLQQHGPWLSGCHHSIPVQDMRIHRLRLIHSPRHAQLA